LSAVPPFEETLHKFVGIEEKTKISALTYITSASIIVTGLAISYVFYLGGVASPASVRSIAVLRAGHKVLENRYYIDEVYRKVFVDGFTALSRVVRDGLEIRVIDGLNYASARAFQKIVEAVRYVQTGSSNINISGVAIGLILLLVFFFARLTGLI
jgi:NADH-quinone oxidoreductase subunit L